MLAPDNGSDAFQLVNVVRHDDAYSWASKRMYTTNAAPKVLEVRDVQAIEQLTPQLEKAAAAADSLLFAKYSNTVLRELGIDEQLLRAVRTIIDKPQLETLGTLLPEDQFEVLRHLDEGLSPEEVYRDVVAIRRPVDAGPDIEGTTVNAYVPSSPTYTAPSPASTTELLSPSVTRTSGDSGRGWSRNSHCHGRSSSWLRSTGMSSWPKICAPLKPTAQLRDGAVAAHCRS